MKSASTTEIHMHIQRERTHDREDREDRGELHAEREREKHGQKRNESCMKGDKNRMEGRGDSAEGERDGTNRTLIEEDLVVRERESEQARW